MSTPEYLVSSVHTPLDPSFRTWEKAAQASTVASARAASPARHSVGPSTEIADDKESMLSGVLSPSELRLRYPDGIPKTPKQVEIERHGDKPKRGTKFNVLEMDDVRREAPPPELRDYHVWG